MSYISIKNISFSYGKEKVLDNIDLSIEKNEIVALVGPSGCGKSTLLRIILGLEDIQSGEISVNNRLLASVKKSTPIHDRNMGIVFQNPSLFPHMTVKKNIEFGLKNAKKKLSSNKIDEYLALVELDNAKDKFPHMLSGGEQQRISLIRSLIINPDVVLLDEPFANLDSVIRRKIRADVLDILKEFSSTAIFVTHDPYEAMEIADRIIILNEGKIVQEGQAEELYAHPNSMFSATFFGFVNALVANFQENKLDLSFASLELLNFPKKTQKKLSQKKDEKDFLVYIRPENLLISRQKNEENVPCTVERVMFSGSYSAVFVKIAGLSELIRVDVKGGSEYKVGDEVFVHLHFKHLLVI